MSGKTKIEWTEKDEQKLRNIEVLTNRMRWSDCSNTPLMPMSKDDPSYLGAAHLFIAAAPARMRWLIRKLKAALRR